MKKKLMKKISTLLVLSIILTPQIASAAEYIVCGSKKFPSAIVNVVATFITIIKIVVPILLVVGGMISFLKVTFSSNVEEELKKAKTKLINSIIAAAVVFFVVSIVNFAVSLVAGKDNEFMGCVKCFMNPDKCETIEIEDDELKPGFINEQ